MFERRTGFTQKISLIKIFSFIGRPVFYFFLGLGYLLLIIVSFTYSLTKEISLSLTKFVRTIIASVISFPSALQKIKIAPPISLKIRIKPTLKLFIFFLGISLTIFFSWRLYLLIFSDMPSPSKLAKPLPLTTKIFDRNGKLLYKIYRNENRTHLSLEKIPLAVRQATIAIEDKDFYFHQGFSLRGIARALYLLATEGKVSGGSTITQQLVKNNLLGSEQTLKRKIKELVLAILVEKKFSKNQILEMYLNEVGYGGSAYGIEEASQKYFDKPSMELSLAEAALLAGLPASPTAYSPFGSHPEQARIRQVGVLRRMTEDGYITEKEAKEAMLSPINFAEQKEEIFAPHFVMYVKEILAERFGEKLLEEGGLEITTSLDLNLQETAQKIVKEEIEKLKKLRVGNGAALITNPKTGEILAMVGSKDYFAKEVDGNYNITTALRQPGSSIKPIMYSIALGRGFTLTSVISDTPITYKVPGQPPYSPQNYDRRFHGNITLRVALGSSYNVPAVKVLAAFGVEEMIKRGQKMGITSWDDPSRFGLSLTLGGGEVKMTDMAVAYGVLANQGTKTNLKPILEIIDRNGKVIKEEECQDSCSTQAIDPGVAFLLTDVLADNRARTPAFGPRSLLVIPNHTAAVKTGTTQNLRDNWTIGYTPSFLVAAWVGNNDNSSMSYVASGVTGASPIWNKIMNFLLAGKPNETFAKPANIVVAQICSLTGTLTCQGCPTRSEFFLAGTEPKQHCNPENIRLILEGKPKEEAQDKQP